MRRQEMKQTSLRLSEQAARDLCDLRTALGGQLGPAPVGASIEWAIRVALTLLPEGGTCNQKVAPNGNSDTEQK